MIDDPYLWWARFFYRTALEIQLGWIDGDPRETMDKSARFAGIPVDKGSSEE